MNHAVLATVFCPPPSTGSDRPLQRSIARAVLPRRQDLISVAGYKRYRAADSIGPFDLSLYHRGFSGMARHSPENTHINRTDGRQCGRKRFRDATHPTAACKTTDSVFIAPISNISSNGAFIKTARQFSVGQEVAMTITFPSTGESHMVTGEVVRVSSDGIGINFKVFFKD